MDCNCKYRYYIASTLTEPILVRTCDKCNHFTYHMLSLMDNNELETLYKALSVLQSLKEQQSL